MKISAIGFFGKIVGTARAGGAEKLTPPADGWYHLAPFCESEGLITVEGKQQLAVRIFNRAGFEQIVERFRAKATEMRAADPNWKGFNVDADHLSYRGDNKTERYAWMTDLKIVGTGAERSDGLWCKLELTDIGAPAVTGGVYSFLSGVFGFEKTEDGLYVAAGLTGTYDEPRTEGAPENQAAAAFTNDPGLPVRAFCRAGQFGGPISATAPFGAGGKQTDPALNAGKGQNKMTPEQMRALLCKLLGKPETCSDQELQAAAAAVPDATAMEKVQAKCRALETENTELKVGKEADEFIKQHANIIADKAKFRALYIKDPATAKEFIANVKPVQTEKPRSYHRAETPAAEGAGADKSGSPEDIGRQQRAHIEQVKKDTGLKGSAAFRRARELKPELFPETNKSAE